MVECRDLDLPPTRTGTLLRMGNRFRPDQTQAYHGRYGWQQYVAALEQVLARTD
jgi:hypothetical protein